MRYHLLQTVLLIGIATACAQTSKTERVVGGPCEDCQLMFEGMPEKLSWDARLADESGEPMTISGTIFKSDGKTPAPGVVLYLYHTDVTGNYTPAPNQKDARRHGHLRGWMKTDESGKYQFTSIRPASYPSRNAPQHIHPIIKEPNTAPYWIDEYLFDDDPLLSQEEKNSQKKRGGSGIIHLTKNSQGVWVGKRDIILGMNVPNY